MSEIDDVSEYFYVDGDKEGHLKFYFEDSKSTNPILDLTYFTSANAKGKIGVEMLGSMRCEITTGPVALEFKMKGLTYIIRPFKTKKETLLAVKSAQLLGFPLHAVTMKNFIDIRSDAYFVTRKLTYCCLERSNFDNLNNINVNIEHRTKMQLIMFIHGIGGRLDGDFITVDDVTRPAIFYPISYDYNSLIHLWIDWDLVDIEWFEKYVEKLTDYDYFRGREVLTSF
jgi:hypothetical protein